MARLGTIGISLLLLASPAFAQNPYYDHGTFPSGGSLGSSAAMRAELDLIEAGFAKLPTISGNANKVVIVNSGATALTATDAPIPSGAAFPVSPGVNALFFSADDSSAGACDSAGGTQVTLCRWDGSAWVGVVGVGASTLDAAFDGGRVINSATSALPMEVGNGTQAVELGGDPTLGGFVRPKPLGDSGWRCWTNFNCIIRDEEAGATILTIDPDAASKNAMYQFGTNYKPLTTIHVPLNPRGAATGAYESILSNQPNDYYLTVTDANTDAADFTFFVTNKMAGATTATFRLVGVSKNATPSGNIDFDCAMSTFTPGTDTYTAHVTTGEVTALLTPATQNRPVAVTTASHTINGGALVAGDIVKGSCEVDAGATTSAQMSDFRLEGVVAITLEVNSLSE